MAEDYKILGQVESIPGSVVSLYTVPAEKHAISSVLSIVNTGSSSATYSVFAVPSSESASVLVQIGEAWVQLGADIDGEASGDQSGWAVAMSADGNRIAIGAPFNDGNGDRSGHVRVYEWDGTAWVQLGADIDGEADNNDSGYSVSLSADGSRVAIGAPMNDGDSMFSNKGHVRVYEWNGSAWVQLGADIDGEAAQDFSGWSVSLSGDGSRVAIGAPFNDGDSMFSNKGHVRVYEWNGSAWVQLGADIDGEAAEDDSGKSVSLSADGSRVAIGSYDNDTDGGGVRAGHVRVYEWNGTAWVQLGADIDGEAYQDESGYSVSLSGDGSRVAIGAPFNDGGGADSGHVRVYEWNGTAWVQLGGDIDGEAAGDQAGWSVSLSGDGSRVAIGAPGNDGNGSGSGHVRVYSWSGTAWVQLGVDIDGESNFDNLGSSVALSADGSRLASGTNLNKAKIYNFNFSSTAIVPQNKHTLINSKTISSGVHDEIVGGIQLSAGDVVFVSSSSGDVVFNMYGVETL
jgi:FG-GAP repeat